MANKELSLDEKLKAIQALEKKAQNTYSTDVIQYPFKNVILNALTYGGIEQGKIYQICSDSGVGKTVLMLQMCKELMDLNENFLIMFNDAERGLNNIMLNNVGLMKYIEQGRFIIKQECDIHETLNLIDNYKDTIDLFVIDSLAALDSGMYLGKDKNNADNPRVGGETRSLKVLLKQMLRVSQVSNLTFMFTNHLRPDIGSYVESTSMGGGVTPEYLSSLILELKRVGGANATIKDANGNPALVPVRAKMRKSRYGPSNSFLPFYVRLGYGVQTLLSLKSLLPDITTTYNGEPHKMIEITAGSASNHLYLNNKDIPFRGIDNALQVIKDNYKEILESLTWSQLCPQINHDSISEYLDPDIDNVAQNVNTAQDYGDIPSDLKAYMQSNNLNPDLSLDTIDLSSDKFKLIYDRKSHEYTLTIDGETYIKDNFNDITDLLDY